MPKALEERMRPCGLPEFGKYAVLLFKKESITCCKAGPDFDSLDEAFVYAEVCCRCSNMYKEGWRMEVYNHEGEIQTREASRRMCKRAA